VFIGCARHGEASIFLDTEEATGSNPIAHRKPAVQRPAWGLHTREVLMAIHDVSIKRALSSQTDLINHREHCSVDPQTLAVIGCTVGYQVRIKRNSNQRGLYTVSEVGQNNPANVVRMGLGGRQRLGTSAEFDGMVDSQVPNPTLTEDDAEAASEFIERLEDNGRQDGLIAIAPHGGDIERHTDQQAERVASRLAVSSWRCKGWNQSGGAFDG
jgi:hypothetical protein